MVTRWKSFREQVSTKLVKIAVVIAMVGALLIGTGAMVGENFALVFDSTEYAASARAKSLLNQGRGFAWELFTSYPDPARQRMALFNLSDPVPFFYYVQEGASPVLTNIGDVGDVQAFFQSLPLFNRVESTKTSLIIYIGVSETVFAAEAAQYAADRGRVSAAFVVIMVGLLWLALGTLGFAYATWRSAAHTVAQPRWWDKIPLDLGLGVLLWLSLASAYMVHGLRFAFHREETWGWLASGLLLTVALTMAGLCYVYLAARQLRGRRLLRQTLVGSLVYGVKKLLDVDSAPR